MPTHIQRDTTEENNRKERRTCKKNLNHVVIDLNNLSVKGREKEGIQSKEISKHQRRSVVK